MFYIAVDNRLNKLHYALPTGDNEIARALSRVATVQDKQAFELLFKHFAPKIRAFGLQRFGQEAQALELVQETMLNIWQKAPLFDADKGKASTWIYTVMRNHCFDMLRKKKTKKEEQLSDDLWPILETATNSSAKADHLLSRQLLRNITCLPEQQEQIVRAVYIDDLTQQEVADLLSIPLGTVKSRLRLAIAKLKAVLEVEDD